MLEIFAVNWSWICIFVCKNLKNIFFVGKMRYSWGFDWEFNLMFLPDRLAERSVAIFLKKNFWDFIEDLWLW
jgi:hypothetical protein